MELIDKILKGLEICSVGQYSDCDRCPYNSGYYSAECITDLTRDALNILTNVVEKKLVMRKE